MNIKELRAKLNADREIAMARFERDWGTRDASKVFAALHRTSPGSASPADALRKAQAIMNSKRRED